MKRSLRSWLWRVPVEEEVDEEIAFHVEMRTRDLVERGIAHETARDMALSRAGNLRRLRRTCVDLGRKREREMRLTQWLEELAADVRFAVRQLRAAPGFSAVAALTLALGIGANSAMFALADITLIRPLPFADPDRLVLISETMASGVRTNVAPANFSDWRTRAQTFASMAAYNGSGHTITGADGTAEIVPGLLVTPEFFDVLGVAPLLGRGFRSSDVTPAPDVVVLSEGFWRTRFGGEPGIIGRKIVFGTRSHTIIGVVPAANEILGSVWTLLPTLRTGVEQRALRVLRVVGRLRPGATVESARADMAAVAGGLAREFPDANRGRGAAVEPFRDALIGGELRRTSGLLLGVVGFVLLMCCATVANLVLARMAGRARELAVRAALGAGRRRLAAQMLTESLVLAGIGGSIGILVGTAILEVAPSLLPEGLLPGSATLAVDGRIVAFCALTATVVGLLFGLVPAWQSTRTSLAQATATDGRGVTARGGIARTLLVVSEVAAAVVLLCGAGLLLRTLLALDGVDAGYRAERVLTMQVVLPHLAPGSRYGTQEAMHRYYDAAEQEIARLPGVRSVGWASTLPLGASAVGRMSFDILGVTPSEAAPRPAADYQIVSPSYFRTLEIPIVRGRGFDDRDTGNATPVCIVSEAFVRRHLQGRDPIGLRVSVRAISAVPAPPVVRQIVGVARQVKARPDEPEDLVQVYVPNAQNTWLLGHLLVRPESGSAEGLVPSVRAALRRVDPDQPVMRIRSLEDVAAAATARPRFRAAVVLTFAAVALVLAMVGVFGVLAHTVRQRTRELGVRIALGASTSTVLRLVLASTGRVIGVGALIGLGLAAALGRSLATFLFGVQPLDPLTFAAVGGVVLVTAAAAAAAPAWRASRVDPVVAFRHE